MKTVTGKILNASGTAQHVRIVFTSTSTPLAASDGTITGETTRIIKSAPSDGSFTIDLAAGSYNVEFQTTPKATRLVIVVPEGAGSVDIQDLIVTSLSYPSISPLILAMGVEIARIHNDRLQILCPDDDLYYDLVPRLVDGVPVPSAENGDNTPSSPEMVISGTGVVRFRGGFMQVKCPDNSLYYNLTVRLVDNVPVPSFEGSGES